MFGPFISLLLNFIFNELLQLVYIINAIWPLETESQRALCTIYENRRDKNNKTKSLFLLMDQIRESVAAWLGSYFLFFFV